MNKIEKFFLMLLIVVFAISSYFFIINLAENKKEIEVYENLQEIIENTEETTQENEFKEDLKEDEYKISSKIQYNFDNILQINSDVIGWIKIDGTNINYPIMQNGDFYLKHDVYKNYSNHGTPYLASFCNIKTSDNLIVFGHHMNDNTMFSQLEKYKNYNFYQTHKYIKVYLISEGKVEENIYEIVTAFKTIAYSDKGFKYYSYTDFKYENEFSEFKNNCKDLEFYNTGLSWSNEDKYITLSTCEYSQKNGRMIVVAKKL